LRFTSNRLFRSEEIELAQALANQAMLAMRLTRLYAESRESLLVAPGEGAIMAAPERAMAPLVEGSERVRTVGLV